MHRVVVTGINTGVGKTIVSAILTTALNGDYWKPIQSGEETDSSILEGLLDSTQHQIHSSAYSLQAPLSPHHAARLENIEIYPDSIRPPQTTRNLVIEGVGGIYVPLTKKISTLDLFSHWNCRWVIVSRHYLGSINHTLLTIEVLKQRKIPIIGIIFNGEPNPDSEEAILEISQLPVLGRLFPEKEINSLTIQRYTKKWQPQVTKLIL